MSTIDLLKGGAVQYRSAEIRDADAKEGILTVLAAPYGHRVALTKNITEEFAPGTFARAVKAPHRLSVFHEHGGPLVGRGFEAEDRPDGILVRSKIGSTLAAKEMLSLVADKILVDASVEFRPIAEFMKIERSGDRYDITHKRADLLGFAMTALGAYGEAAKVLSVRDLETGRARAELEAWLADAKRQSFTP